MPKKMPVGTVSRGRKKVAEGKWVKVAGRQYPREGRDYTNVDIAAQANIDMTRRYKEMIADRGHRASFESPHENIEFYQLMRELVSRGQISSREVISGGKKAALKYIDGQIDRYQKEVAGINKSIDLVIPIENLDTDAMQIFMPTELLKGGNPPSKPQGGKNAKGTVGPRSLHDTGSVGESRMNGAPHPESSKTGQQKSEISKRGGHKKPYKDYKTGIGGEASSAANNFMRLVNVKTGKVNMMKVGTSHKAKFDHAGNLVRVVIDGKKYPVQNHLVKIPSGVYRYIGMVSVASKVMTDV